MCIYLYILEFKRVNIRKPVMLFFVLQEKRVTKRDYDIVVIFFVYF